jgi:hypothetical protein
MSKTQQQSLTDVVPGGVIVFSLPRTSLLLFGDWYERWVYRQRALQIRPVFKAPFTRLLARLVWVKLPENDCPSARP